MIWLAATLAATAVSWAVVQTVSSAVVQQQPAPLSQGAVNSELHSPAVAEAEPSPSPTAAPAAQPSAPPTSAPPAVAPPPASGSTPAPRESTPPPPSATTSSTRTLSLIGGTAQLTCSNNQITLDYATPNAGYWVETGSSDGGSTIDIKFRSDSHESELQAFCSGGQVQGTIQESSS